MNETDKEQAAPEAEKLKQPKRLSPSNQQIEQEYRMNKEDYPMNRHSFPCFLPFLLFVILLNFGLNRLTKGEFSI